MLMLVVVLMLMHKMLVNVMLMLTQVHPKLCLPSVLRQVNQGFPSKKEVSSSLFINFLSMKLLMLMMRMMLTMRMISIKICIFIQGIVTSRCLHSEGRNVRRIQSKFLTKADKTKGKKHVWDGFSTVVSLVGWDGIWAGEVQSTSTVLICI